MAQTTDASFESGVHFLNCKKFPLRREGIGMLGCESRDHV